MNTSIKNELRRSLNSNSSMIGLLAKTSSAVVDQ